MNAPKGQRGAPTRVFAYGTLLLDAGLLEMTTPDTPQSSKQQYRITEAGHALLRGGS
jgi:hypothetical protein